MARWAGLLCFAAIAGCVGDEPLAPPPELAHATRLALISANGQAARVFPPQAGDHFTQTDTERVYLSGYDFDPQGLQLIDGALPTSPAERALPRFDLPLFERDGLDQPWRLAAEPPPPSNMLPAFDYRACLSAQLCPHQTDGMDRCAACDEMPVIARAEPPRLGACEPPFEINPEPHPSLVRVGLPDCKIPVPSCAAPQVAFIAPARCSLVAETCETGDWPSSLPGGTVLYVSPDGSVSAPGGGAALTSLRAAIDQALLDPSVVAIALGEGTASEGSLPEIGRNLIIRGLCASRSHVRLDALAAMRVAGATLSVSGLSLDGGLYALDGKLDVSGVKIQLQAAANGVHLVRSALTMSDSAIAGGSVGIFADHSRIEVQGSVLAGSSGQGIWAEASSIEIRDSSQHDNVFAIQALDGSRLIVERSLFERCGLGVGVYNHSLAHLSQLVVRDGPDAPDSGGVTVANASLLLERSQIEKVTGRGVFVGQGEPQSVTLRDLRVDGVQVSSLTGNTGLGVAIGGVLPDDPIAAAPLIQAERLVLLLNAGGAFFAANSGPLALNDVVALASVSPVPLFGFDGHAPLRAERIMALDAGTDGINLQRPVGSAPAILEDVIVSLADTGVRFDCDGPVHVTRLDLERASIGTLVDPLTFEGNRGALELSDVSVRSCSAAIDVRRPDTRLDHFQIDGGGTALDLRFVPKTEYGTVTASQGRIDGSDIGMFLELADSSVLFGLLDRVRMNGVRVPIASP